MIILSWQQVLKAYTFDPEEYKIEDAKLKELQKLKGDELDKVIMRDYILPELNLTQVVINEDNQPILINYDYLQLVKRKKEADKIISDNKPTIKNLKAKDKNNTITSDEIDLLRIARSETRAAKKILKEVEPAIKLSQDNKLEERREAIIAEIQSTGYKERKDKDDKPYALPKTTTGIAGFTPTPAGKKKTDDVVVAIYGEKSGEILDNNKEIVEALEAMAKILKPKEKINKADRTSGSMKRELSRLKDAIEHHTKIIEGKSVYVGGKDKKPQKPTRTQIRAATVSLGRAEKKFKELKAKYDKANQKRISEYRAERNKPSKKIVERKKPFSEQTSHDYRTTTFPKRTEMVDGKEEVTEETTFGGLDDRNKISLRVKSLAKGFNTFLEATVEEFNPTKDEMVAWAKANPEGFHRRSTTTGTLGRKISNIKYKPIDKIRDVTNMRKALIKRASYLIDSLSTLTDDVEAIKDDYEENSLDGLIETLNTHKKALTKGLNTVIKRSSRKTKKDSVKATYISKLNGLNKTLARLIKNINEKGLNDTNVMQMLGKRPKNIYGWLAEVSEEAEKAYRWNFIQETELFIGFGTSSDTEASEELKITGTSDKMSNVDTQYSSRYEKFKDYSTKSGKHRDGLETLAKEIHESLNTKVSPNNDGTVIMAIRVILNTGSDDITMRMESKELAKLLKDIKGHSKEISGAKTSWSRGASKDPSKLIEGREGDSLESRELVTASSMAIDKIDTQIEDLTELNNRIKEGYSVTGEKDESAIFEKLDTFLKESKTIPAVISLAIKQLNNFNEVIDSPVFDTVVKESKSLEIQRKLAEKTKELQATGELTADDVLEENDKDIRLGKEEKAYVDKLMTHLEHTIEFVNTLPKYDLLTFETPLTEFSRLVHSDKDTDEDDTQVAFRYLKNIHRQLTSEFAENKKLFDNSIESMIQHFEAVGDIEDAISNKTSMKKIKTLRTKLKATIKKVKA